MMTKAEKNTSDISFKIKGVEILDFALKQPQVQIPSETVFHYSLNIQHRINSNKKLITVIVDIRILHEDKKTLLGTIKVGSIFSLEDFDDVAIQNDDSTISFPEKLIENLNNIAISTSRGVMFTCFRGTVLHRAVLPLIDLKGLKRE